MTRPSRLLALALLIAAPALASAADGPTPVAFAAARPILAKCVACHRGDDPAGGLDLTTRSLALEGGETGPVLEPGDPSASRLLRLVERGKMPPRRPLAKGEVEALRSWIASGADWPGEVAPEPSADDPRWALRPLVRPAVPDAPPGTHPIDAFVNARLAASGIAAAPPADRRALLRRLRFDLTGLPPSPEEADAFLADDAPDAADRLADRLLASPSYGERWARHWLDVARFGESHGFEYDHIRERSWPYRDAVINALNADRPYADFARDQIAGDLIPGATGETIAATGFLVAGPMDEAGKIQSNAVMRSRTREEELDDMIAAVGQTFLGMTVNCARCHDHKFDPIPQADYYRFASALAGVQHGERPALTPAEVAAREARVAGLTADAARARDEVARLERAGAGRLVGSEGGSPPVPPDARWSFDADASDLRGEMPGRLLGGASVADGALKLSGPEARMVAGPLRRDLRAKTLEAWVRLANLDQRGGAVISVQSPDGARFDAIVFGERQARVWSAGSESFLRTKDLDAPEEASPLGTTVHVAIAYAEDGTIAVYRDGRPYAPPYQPGKPVAYRAGRDEVLIGLRHTGAAFGHLKGEVEEARLYERALSPEEVAASFRAGPVGADPAAIAAALTPEERALRDAALARRDAAERALAAVPPLPAVYAAVPSKPGVTHVLARGDVEQPGAAVSAGGLSAVTTPSPDLGLPPDAGDRARRLALAGWITHRDNPLFWRVMANRVWHHHFGVGLVATPNDFGANGERPSHPELLDWLACELRDSGGRLKPFHRLMVASDAYRRASRFDPEASKQDADARLLWRFPPKRLEGEAIRDAMLAASGSLNPAMGGPSFRPFNVTVFNSNIYTITDPIGPEFDRRTIYRIHVLSAKSPLLDALDCPDPATKTPRRGVTTTPLQALALMNDSFVNRQAKLLAERARREAGPDLAAQIERAYRLALARPPGEAEAARSLDLARSQGLDDVAWALLNATEFVYVD